MRVSCSDDASLLLILDDLPQELANGGGEPYWSPTAVRINVLLENCVTSSCFPAGNIQDPAQFTVEVP